MQRAAAMGIEAIPLQVDLCDSAATAQAVEACATDAVIHLAAIVELSRVTADPARALAVNAGGTLNLLEAIRLAGLSPWFFYASTSHVYAPSDQPLAEDSPIAPRNLYAATKYAGELIAATYQASGTIRLCTGRIFSLFDDSQSGTYLYPAMAARVRNHDSSGPIVVRDGNTLRDFSPAADIAGHILALAASGATGLVNIASGQPRPVIDQVRDWFGNRAEFVPSPGPASPPIVADVTRLEALLREPT